MVLFKQIVARFEKSSAEIDMIQLIKCPNVRQMARRDLLSIGKKYVNVADDILFN